MIKNTTLTDSAYDTIDVLNTKYKIGKSTRLHIKMTDACNGKCPFCVARLGKLRKENIIDHLEQKIKIAITKLNVKNVVLLGGEPTISKNLFPILYELKKYKQQLSEITIITNGVKLRDEDFVHKLANSCITAVNISIHHWNKRINSNLMKIDSLSKKELIKIKNMLHQQGKQLWLSVVLMKNYIDNTEKALKYIKHYATIVDQIRFFPISSTKEHETIPDVALFTKSHLIESSVLQSIIKDVIAEGTKIQLDPAKFNPQAYSSAMVYHQHVIFKSTEIHKDIDDEKNNLIYSIKLLPTGKLTNTYHDRGLDFFQIFNNVKQRRGYDEKRQK